MTTQNIVEYAKGMEPGVPKAVVEIFAKNSDFLAVLPFQAAPGGAYRYNLESTLPGIGFRGINEAYTPTIGVINPQVEQTFIAGGEIKVDKALVRRFGETRRSREENMQIKSLCRTISTKLVTGSNATSIKEFDGVKTRLGGSNVQHNSASSGGAAMSLYNLDTLIDTVTEPTHLLMPKAMRRRLTQAGRNTGVGGYVAQTKNDFGQLIMSYRDIPILVGYENEADTALLAFDEVASGGGSAVTCSIYCFSLKEGHMTGLQVAPMDVQDLGEMETTPALLTRVEWDVGLCIEHPYAAVRLDSITNAAITA